MGGAESVIPKEHKTGNKILDISRDVSHRAFIKVISIEVLEVCLL